MSNWNYQEQNMDLRIPENGFDFRPQIIFQIGTETKTWVHYKDVPWAIDSANIYFHTER